jgi:hypothetical protein
MEKGKQLSEEEILSIFSEYKDVDDLKINNPLVYYQAKDLGILGKMEKMMKAPKPYTQMTDSEIIELAKKYSTKVEIQEFEPSVYSQVYKRSLTEQAFAHCEKDKTKTEFSNEEILEVARKYEKFHDFMLNDKTFYNIAGKRGLINQIKSFLVLRKDVVALSNEELILIAKEFKSREELQKNEAGVHKEIYKRGIGKVAFSHIPLSKNPNYTPEDLLLEMAKYNSQKYFFANDSKRFYAAKKKGLLKGYYK